MCSEATFFLVLDFVDGRNLAAEAAVLFSRALEDLLHSTTDEQFTLACMASRRPRPEQPNVDAWAHIPASCFTYADSLSLSFWEDLSSAWNARRSASQRPCRLLGRFTVSSLVTLISPGSSGKEVDLECATGTRRFFIDVTSLVAPEPDQLAISDRHWVL